MTKQVVDRLLQERICFYCGVGIDRNAPMYHPCKTTIDHVQPLKYGGTNDESNLVAACYKCNIGKRAMPVERFRERMAKRLA